MMVSVGFHTRYFRGTSKKIGGIAPPRASDDVNSGWCWGSGALLTKIRG